MYVTRIFFIPKTLQLSRPEVPHTWLSPRTPNCSHVTPAHKNLNLLNQTARIHQESVIYICVKEGYQSSYVCITEQLPARWQVSKSQVHVSSEYAYITFIGSIQPNTHQLSITSYTHDVITISVNSSAEVIPGSYCSFCKLFCRGYSRPLL